MTRVGFIGLGVMGSPMSVNVARDYPVTLYDVDSARVEQARKLCGEARADGEVSVAESIESLAAECQVTVLSLPGSHIVEGVVLDHLATSLAPGSVVIDTSTTEPTVSRKISEDLSAAGIAFLDAPVSGGEKGAQDGSLSIMVGGEESVFDRCLPILKTMGASVVRVGDAGMGEVVKLVNNLIVGITFAAVAEGFALGVDSGVDPEVLFQAIRGGWAGSKVLEVSAPAMISGDFTPGGTVDIHWKDLGYALSLAKDQDVPTPMTALAHEVFKAARASGRGKLSQPAIIQLWEDLLDIRVAKGK